MGLFNGKAQAQLRAQHLASLIQGLAEGNLDQSIGAGDDPIWTPVYDSLARLQKSLRQQQVESASTEALDKALVEMTRQHSEGWIDEIIPVDRFGGTQARIAKGINELVAAHIAVKMQVVGVVTAYGRGDFSKDMERLPGKKAQVTEAIDGVRDRLKAAAQAAGENIRIKSALDNVTANVMIADGERNIIYMNKTVTSMLQNAEADLRKALPSFSVSKLLGGSIDQFHKNPEHQKRLLATFTSTFRTQIDVGGRTFGLVANPVISDAGERLGSVVEWADRTLEVQVEREVAALVGAAAAGDFSKRIDETGKTGFILNLATGLNSLVETADKGLKDVSRMLGALAQGDLSQSISADYQGTFGELKDYSNETAQSLSRMLGQIREAADTINTAASEIASGNAELSTRTEQQASSLEETASSMEELTSTVKLNAENARQANSLAVNASEVATEGGNVVQKVVSTMTAINDSARKISDIIGVIDGIAFQTNILALNAAVEAARAGEQGRGFAVVAAEVRTLAQRSAAAAKEIKTLISDSVSKVENGNTLVAQAGQTMSDIVIAIKRVTDIMAEIAAASTEQSRGIEEVNGAVSQMDEMTQQNAALVEEAAAAAEALQEQAGLMAQSVAVFKLDPAHAGQAGTPRNASRKTPSAKSPRGAGRAARSKEEEWEEF
ncbi:methyl-accepting chemotaxis protein [Pseudomonas sp. JM0905a]|uniref:Methyl-accepting chemotaxis protein n=1 Tax=Metapseudomonas resinovorans TaxID=53412 RepID=A0ABT4Y3V5_METRE|nr:MULTISPECIES: methyl-accepting chemotaxis protein [Pseudomonas]MBD2836174.1 methyl-accepting chemotaxis protein [Pseudomonas sp. JM0905a]MDA8483295.1 methyl-accepting chemotaxis protein [Pseudomonas resinovorans]